MAPGAGPPGPAWRTALDDLLPRPHWRTFATTWVGGDPARVFLAVEQVTLGEVPGAAMHRRSEARGDRSGSSVLNDLLEQGFFLLFEESDVEMVLGRVGKFWRPGGARESRVGGRAGFVAFDDPGYAKAALSLRTFAVDGGTVLVVETRVVATDPETFQQFNRHWLVGSWANRAGRRQLLSAVKDRVHGPDRL